MITKGKPGRPKGTSGKARSITDKELGIVLKVTAQSKTHAKRNVALLVLSHYLGLRVKELSLLKIRDVFDGVEIKKTLRLLAKYTKGEKHRDVSLENKRVIEALEDYIIYRKEIEGKHFSQSAPLFRSGQGWHFTPNALCRVFIDLYHKAGIENASSHTGRRSLITKLAYNGIDLNSIRQIAGHKSIATTQLYIADNPQVIADILKSI